jgi:hypothetical protein
VTSYYSIIQVTADPLADERINLGVVVLGDGPSDVRFTSDVVRTARFLGNGATALDVHQLISGVQKDLELILNHEESLRKMREVSERWQQTVRITPPRASTLDIDELARRVGSRALPAHAHGPRARDRRAAIALAGQKLRVAVKQLKASVQVKRHR